ncbi:hypothetical protein F8144_39415 [Streptomyces triticiradicis]|uniref:Uncharacterized protein n=1 Tax=Streptomyces triticiradicis TaxID=2651189 RepID=A0A7J5D3J5_9ACTN|nr:hypothetical protein F8144_39415 [Streptomyces triticiradicis]
MATTALAPPVSEPDPSAMLCSGSQVGPCARCGRPPHKYGQYGLPLCKWCFEPAREGWGNTVRFKDTRPGTST